MSDMVFAKQTSDLKWGALRVQQSRLLSFIHFIFGASMALISPALAQQTGQPKCEEGEKFYPEGRIIALGDRKFKLCNGRFNTNPSGQWVSLSIRDESSVDTALAQDFSGLDYVSSIRSGRFKGGKPYALHQNVHTLSAGGITYSVSVLSFEVNDAHQAISEGRLPKSAVYHAAAGQGVPGHYLTCNVPMSPPFPNGMFCRLEVVYRPGEDLFIGQIYLKSESWDFAGFGEAEFSLENLPNHVLGLHRAYQALEVKEAD